MIARTVDWTPLTIAAEQRAVEELENTVFWPAVVSAAQQQADPDEAKRQFLQLFPTWEGHARYFEMAVRYLQRGTNGQLPG
jgi:hypothetical protein